MKLLFHSIRIANNKNDYLLNVDKKRFCVTFKILDACFSKIRGGSKIFSRRVRISKKNRKNCRFFIGQSNRFFELSEITITTLFYPNFWRRRKFF